VKSSCFPPKIGDSNFLNAEEKTPSHLARCRLADFRFAHPDITAIIWNFPAEISQISLRETSINRDVKSNF